MTPKIRPPHAKASTRRRLISVISSLGGEHQRSPRLPRVRRRQSPAVTRRNSGQAHSPREPVRDARRGHRPTCRDPLHPFQSLRQREQRVLARLLPWLDRRCGYGRARNPVGLHSTAASEKRHKLFGILTSFKPSPLTVLICSIE